MPTRRAVFRTPKSRSGLNGQYESPVMSADTPGSIGDRVAVGRTQRRLIRSPEFCTPVDGLRETAGRFRAAVVELNFQIGPTEKQRHTSAELKPLFYRASSLILDEDLDELKALKQAAEESGRSRRSADKGSVLHEMWKLCLAAGDIVVDEAMDVSKSKMPKDFAGNYRRKVSPSVYPDILDFFDHLNSRKIKISRQLLQTELRDKHGINIGIKRCGHLIFHVCGLTWGKFAKHKRIWRDQREAKDDYVLKLAYLLDQQDAGQIIIVYVSDY
jgi:hypothetical protein